MQQPRTWRREHIAGLVGRNGLNATTNSHIHAIANDLFGRNANGHHARGTLAIDALAGHCVRQTRFQQTLPGGVEGAATHLQGGSHDNVFYLTGLYAGTLYGMLDGMSTQALTKGVIECTTIGFADRGTSG